MTNVTCGDDADEVYRVFDHIAAPIGSDGTPFEYYEALRDAAQSVPVGRSEAHGGFWVVAGFDECSTIFQNHQSFSNAAVAFPAYQTGQDSPLKLAGQDEPAHRRDRAFMARPFLPKQIAHYGDRVRTMTTRLIDEFIETGQTDVGHSLGDEIPARVTALILGSPEEDGKLYGNWLWAMSHLHTTDPQKAMDAVAEMHRYFSAVIEERRRKPGEDMLSTVAHFEINGDRLTDDDLMGFCIILLIGGIDNTAKILNTALWRLGWDPELRRRLARSPALLNTAVEEVLRYYSPTALGRLAVNEEITVGNVTMKKDDIAVLALPVANRDHRAFPNPDTFIADRTPNKHLALGGGVHRCLGLHLARVEVRAALAEFLRRIPDYQLSPDRNARWATGQVQGMGEVPIVFPPGDPVITDARTRPV